MYYIFAISVGHHKYLYMFFGLKMMVQRALAAKSLSHAQGGTLFAGYIKLLPLFLMVLPGMISRVLFTSKILKDRLSVYFQFYLQAWLLTSVKIVLS